MGMIKDKIYNYLEARLGTNTRERFVSNINLDLTSKQKRVLIVYLDIFSSSNQIMDSVKRISGACHTNRFELFQIIKCFIRLDYCIDVCANYDLDAIKYIENHKYDVILGLGEVFRRVSENTEAFKILYMTENPYYVSLVKEKERIEYFKQRTGKELPLHRTGMFFKDGDEKKADAIICMGEETYFKHLNIPVERIYPSGFYNDKEFNISNRKRKSFLVFGTDGFVHKGVDLLVEVFNKHLEWQLYICGYHIMEEVERLGLTLTDNIHDCGYIDVRSDRFVELVEECTYILLPSCSESTSTSILTGMRHALIPIVTHGNGFDELSQYCYFFDSFLIEDIEKKIIEILEDPETDVIEFSKKIQEMANQQFSLEQFTERLYVALKHLLDY